MKQASNVNEPVGCQAMEDLLQRLVCPTCKKYMKPPILKCISGHSLCRICRSEYESCPICKTRFTNDRDLALELLANNLSLLPLKEAPPVRGSPARCPLSNCTWTGNPFELSAHWLSKKMTLKPYKDENICTTKISEKYSYYTNMLGAHDATFFFKCMANKGNFYWAVQLVGNKGDAERYYYEIEILKPGRWKTKFILSTYCQPIHLSNEELFKEDVCTFTPIALLSPYLGSDNTLLYYLRVKVVDPSDHAKSEEAVSKFLSKRADRFKGQASNK